MFDVMVSSYYFDSVLPIPTRPKSRQLLNSETWSSKRSKDPIDGNDISLLHYFVGILCSKRLGRSASRPPITLPVVDHYQERLKL